MIEALISVGLGIVAVVLGGIGAVGLGVVSARDIRAAAACGRPVWNAMGGALLAGMFLGMCLAGAAMVARMACGRLPWE